jgi:hypothetical protein
MTSDAPRVDTDSSSPISLAVENRDGAELEIDVSGFEGECLAHPESGAVHDGDEGTFSDAGGRVAALVEDGEHLVGAEDLGGEREPFVRRDLPGAGPGSAAAVLMITPYGERRTRRETICYAISDLCYTIITCARICIS